jgi:hypothetical protein
VSLAAAMVKCSEFVETADFDRFRENIDPGWIEEALAQSGTATLRKRRLPAEQVVWLVIGMALLRNLPIRAVVSRLDLVLPDAQGSKLAHSAIPQARKRLGDAPIKWLFERCAREWALKSARLTLSTGLRFSPWTEARCECLTQTRTALTSVWPMALEVRAVIR